MRKERTKKANIIHKNKLYSKFNYKDFEGRLNATNDLQGFRNKIIDLIPELPKPYICIDVGCGIGDKMYRFFQSKKKKISKIYLLDYSKQSKRIFDNINKSKKISFISSDANKVIKNFSDNYFNLFIMLGFFHELQDKNLFLKKINKKLSKNSLIIISDNNLYYTAEDLLDQFTKIGVKGTVYTKLTKFFFINIFKEKSNFDTNKKNFVVLFHQGRVDAIVGVFGECLANFKLNFPLKNVFFNKKKIKINS